MSPVSETARSSNTGGSSLGTLEARLIGTWRLVSAEDYDPKTKKWVPYTFGNPPSGYFIYGASGYASVQIMFTPPVQLSNPDNGPTPDEALKILNRYIAYYGRWKADEKTITVVPEGNLNPAQLGAANPQTRPYQLNGDTLTIGSTEAGYIRTLQRVG
ncbi:MAG TPA: lipocalin-like domain-containing protein [Archangium sp.]|nr:lipocalin-like domain-containing protein [Archangium sp.]